MTKGRSIAALLTLAFITTAFAGCLGGDGGGGEEPTPTTPTQTTPTNGGGGTQFTRLVVGTDATYPPMESYDESTGTFSGFDIDLMREIGTIMGAEIEFRNVGWDALPPSLNDGSIDVIASSMTITDERKEDRDFTQPYYEVDQAVLVKRDSTIANESDLSGKVIAVQEGTTADLWVEENLVATGKTSASNVKRFQTYPEAANAVVTGAADAVIIDRPPQVQFASENPSTKVVFDIDTNEPLGLAVKKGRLELVNALNDALDELKANGKLDELRAKWDL